MAKATKWTPGGTTALDRIKEKLAEKQASERAQTPEGKAEQEQADKDYIKQVEVDKKAAAAKADANTKKSIVNKDQSLKAVHQVKAGPTVKAGKVALGDKVTTKAIKEKQVSVGTVRADKVKASQVDAKGLASDSRATDAMRNRAMGGDSPWLKMQMEKQDLEQTSAMDQAARQGLSGASTARSQLAMNGGMGGGSRERIAGNAARDINAQRQNIGRQGQMDRLGLGIADDNTKMGLLGQTAGLDLQRGAQGQNMGMFNADKTMQGSLANAGMALDASKSNVGFGLAASQANAGNNLQAQQLTAGNKLGADQFNSGMQFDANKMQTGNQFQADLAHSGQAFSAGSQNAQAGIGGVFENNDYLMKKKGADAAADAIAGAGGSSFLPGLSKVSGAFGM